MQIGEFLTDENKQKTLIYKLCNFDVLAATRKVLNVEYFDKKHHKLINHITDTFDNYKCIPPVVDLVEYGLETDKLQFLSSQQTKLCIADLYKYCQYAESAISLNEAQQLVNVGKYDCIIDKFRSIINMQPNMNVGLDYFDTSNTRQRIIDNNMNVAIPTGIKELDDAMGGLGRKELCLFLAVSNGGKSLMKNNLAASYAARGYNVLYISLEMSDSAIAGRFDSIIADVRSNDAVAATDEIITKLNTARQDGWGILNIKKLPEGSTTADDIRTQLDLFENNFKQKVDVLLIDYIDLMKPCSNDSDNLFIREKFIAEEVRAVIIDYDVVGISSSQFNRSAHSVKSIDDIAHDKIAGGMSKINTADYVFGIYRDREDRRSGTYQLTAMKVRRTAVPTTPFILKLNTNNIRFRSADDQLDIITRSRLIYKQQQKVLNNSIVLDEIKPSSNRLYTPLESMIISGNNNTANNEIIDVEIIQIEEQLREEVESAVKEEYDNIIRINEEVITEARLDTIANKISNKSYLDIDFVKYAKVAVMNTETNVEAICIERNILRTIKAVAKVIGCSVPRDSEIRELYKYSVFFEQLMESESKDPIDFYDIVNLLMILYTPTMTPVMLDSLWLLSEDDALAVKDTRKTFMQDGVEVEEQSINIIAKAYNINFEYYINVAMNKCDNFKDCINIIMKEFDIEFNNGKFYNFIKRIESKYPSYSKTNLLKILLNEMNLGNNDKLDNRSDLKYLDNPRLWLYNDPEFMVKESEYNIQASNYSKLDISSYIYDLLPETYSLMHNSYVDAYRIDKSDKLIVSLVKQIQIMCKLLAMDSPNLETIELHCKANPKIADILELSQEYFKTTAEYMKSLNKLTLIFFNNFKFKTLPKAKSLMYADDDNFDGIEMDAVINNINEFHYSIVDETEIIEHEYNSVENIEKNIPKDGDTRSELLERLAKTKARRGM